MSSKDNNPRQSEPSDQSSLPDAPEEYHTPTPTSMDEDAIQGANLTDKSWMDIGLREMIRQRAHDIYAQFNDADNWTSSAMEEHMYDTEEEIINAYGPERAMDLLEPEMEFIETNVYGAYSVVPALLTTAASMFVLRRAPTFLRGMGAGMGRYRSSSSSAKMSHFSSNSVGPTSGGQGNASGSGYQFSPPTSGGGRGRVVSTLRFVAEFTVSSMLGLTVFDYTIGNVEDNEDATKVPLVEGISITSMYKCPAYMNIYGRECQEGFWNNYKKMLASEEDESLRKNLEYYEKWALNCARRDMVEQATRIALEGRKRNQLAPGTAFDPQKKFTPIPPPGVPEDLYVNRENIGRQNNAQNEL